MGDKRGTCGHCAAPLRSAQVRFMRRVALSVALALSVAACTSLNDLPLLGMGDQPAQTVVPTESKTPGLAIDRPKGQPPFAAMKGTVLIAPNGAKRTDYFYWLN